MARIVFEGMLDTSVEYGGAAKIGELRSDFENENGMFVRIQSWDINLAHEDYAIFDNKRVRVTVEIIDGDT